MNSVFKRETIDFTFSLRNDNTLIIYINDDAVPTATLDRYNSVGSSVVHYYTLPFKTVVKLEISNFFETMASHASGLLVQYVLSAFKEQFLPKGDQREQITEGLIYFVHAKHYKLFEQADPKPLLNKYIQDYKDIRERYPIFLEEHDRQVEKARVQHLNDPLVASTGLIVYSTLQCNWYVYETQERSLEAPEYLYAVDSRSQTAFHTDSFKGRQKECINFVMQQQIDLYGISFEQVLKKKQENEALRTMIKELEIVTRVPLRNRLETQEEAATQQEHDEASLDQNLTRLNAYATLTK